MYANHHPENEDSCPEAREANLKIWETDLAIRDAKILLGKVFNVLGKVVVKLGIGFL